MEPMIQIPTFDISKKKKIKPGIKVRNNSIVSNRNNRFKEQRGNKVANRRGPAEMEKEKKVWTQMDG